MAARRVAPAFLVSLILVVVPSLPAWASSAGHLDPGGKVTTDFSGSGSFDLGAAVAIQSNGKIVVAGWSNAGGSTDFALARYNTNLSLDTTFGTNGKVTTDVGGSGTRDDNALALAIQSDGKIVVAGSSDSGTSSDFALARYTTTGALDTTFGTSGKVTTDFSGAGSTDQGSAVAIQSDGKIVLAGSSDAGGSADFALARYTTTGALDSTFDPAGSLPGTVTTDFSGAGSSEAAEGLAIQSDGKIVVAGSSDAGGSTDFALARYTTAGALDSTFDPAGSLPGTVTTSFGGSDQAVDVAIQTDGKIVAGGQTDAGGSQDFALARYTTAGALDTTFDPAGSLPGTVTTDFSGPGSSDGAEGLAIQSDGKIVAAGFTMDVGSLLADFALARYATGGTLDAAFGKMGKVATDIRRSSDDVANAVAIQSDGKLVAAGFSATIINFDESPDFAVARYRA